VFDVVGTMKDTRSPPMNGSNRLLFFVFFVLFVVSKQKLQQ
jgi:hypothetical protein